VPGPMPGIDAATDRLPDFSQPLHRVHSAR
jgi:hypothetical protein